MAVLVQLTVTPATQEQFNDLDAVVGQAMEAAGGPPSGLMSHVVYAEGDGFVVADVWRMEADAQQYVENVLRRLVADQGLTAGGTDVRAVWSFARPSGQSRERGH